MKNAFREMHEVFDYPKCEYPRTLLKLIPQLEIDGRLLNVEAA
jgi:hypothetical protein